MSGPVLIRDGAVLPARGGYERVRIYRLGNGVPVRVLLYVDSYEKQSVFEVSAWTLTGWARVDEEPYSSPWLGNAAVGSLPNPAGVFTLGSMMRDGMRERIVAVFDPLELHLLGVADAVLNPTRKVGAHDG